MHDIDGSQRELEMETEHTDERESEAFVENLFEEAGHAQPAAHAKELEQERPLTEAQELELASELLEVSSEAELEYFLGGLFRKTLDGAKAFAKTPQGQAIGALLKKTAKRLLPIAGKALGGMVGGPIGMKIGGALGNAASNLFEMETAGMSAGELEMEYAQRFNRFARSALHHTARAPRRMPPQTAARNAYMRAARRYMPGLVRRGYPAAGPVVVPGAYDIDAPDDYDVVPAYEPELETAALVVQSAAPHPAHHGRSGRWIRHGRKIILQGV